MLFQLVLLISLIGGAAGACGDVGGTCSFALACSSSQEKLADKCPTFQICCRTVGTGSGGTAASGQGLNDLIGIVGAVADGVAQVAGTDQDVGKTANIISKGLMGVDANDGVDAQDLVTAGLGVLQAMQENKQAAQNNQNNNNNNNEQGGGEQPVVAAPATSPPTAPPTPSPPSFVDPAVERDARAFNDFNQQDATRVSSGDEMDADADADKESNETTIIVGAVFGAICCLVCVGLLLFFVVRGTTMGSAEQYGHGSVSAGNSFYGGQTMSSSHFGTMPPGASGMYSHPMGAPTGQLACPHCGKQYAIPSDLEHHMNIRHGVAAGSGASFGTMGAPQMQPSYNTAPGQMTNDYPSMGGTMGAPMW